MHVLVHAVGLWLCVVWHVAILGVAVGAVHPRAFRIWIHCHDVKVLVAVRLGVMRILRWFCLGYWHLLASLPLSDDMGCVLAGLGLCSLLTSLIHFFKLFVQMLRHKAFKYLYSFITFMVKKN